MSLIAAFAKNGDLPKLVHRHWGDAQKFPARLTAEQAAWVLNGPPHDIPVPVAARLLKPLGNPRPNGVKHFAATEVLELVKDRSWLAKITNAVSQHWKQKNRRKKGRCGVAAETGDLPETGPLIFAGRWDQSRWRVSHATKTTSAPSTTMSESMMGKPTEIWRKGLTLRDDHGWAMPAAAE